MQGIGAFPILGPTPQLESRSKTIWHDVVRLEQRDEGEEPPGPGCFARHGSGRGPCHHFIDGLGKIFQGPLTDHRIPPVIAKSIH